MELVMRRRRPKYTPSDISDFEMTPRDREILRLVASYRVLDTNDVIQLLGEGHNERRLKDRLYKLFHTKHLARPRGQRDYIPGGGSKTMVYAIARKGARELAEHDLWSETDAERNWGDKNNSLGLTFVKHQLLTNKIVISAITGFRDHPRLTLVRREQILTTRAAEDQRGRRNPTSFIVARAGERIAVFPDQMFGVDRTDAGPVYFFAEADTGTMRITGASPRQTSIAQKVELYRLALRSWKRDPSIAPFGFDRFRVLFVTKSAQRVHNVIFVKLADAFRAMGADAERFLFTDAPALCAHPFLDVPWRTGSGQAFTLAETL